MEFLFVLAPVLWIATLIGTVLWLRHRPIWPRR